MKKPTTELSILAKHTIPCPGECGHPHVGKTGPCTKTGCGCTASKPAKERKAR